MGDEDRPLTGVRALLVEDDPIIAMVLEDMIVELGGSVVCVADRLHEALSAAADLEIDVDVAVLDLTLAGQSALAVAERLDQRGVPFAFATGAASPPADWKDRPLIRKPFMVADVARALSQALTP